MAVEEVDSPRDDVALLTQLSVFWQETLPILGVLAAAGLAQDPVLQNCADTNQGPPSWRGIR